MSDLSAAAPATPEPTSDYVTIECSAPGERYTLLESGSSFVVHLAGPGQSGGTGPCICGFDRFTVGFSVGGGWGLGPSKHHEACADCAQLADGRPVRGLHAPLFATEARS